MLTAEVNIGGVYKDNMYGFYKVVGILVVGIAVPSIRPW